MSLDLLEQGHLHPDLVRDVEAVDLKELSEDHHIHLVRATAAAAPPLALPLLTPPLLRC